MRRVLLSIVACCLISTSIPGHPGSGIAVDRIGQIYFLDTGSGTWKIDTKGRLTHLSDLRHHWLAVDANSGFANARLPTDRAGDWVLTKVSTNPTVLISTDFPIAIGQDGNLYSPPRRSGDLQIVRTTPSGNTSVFATLPRKASGAPLEWINGITAGPDNSIYYTDDNSIRRINSRGQVSTVATVAALVGGPSIPGTEQHPYLRGLSVDSKGVVYVADNGDARVLKITPDGKITTLLQLPSGPWAPTAVALYRDDLYVLEFLHTEGDDRVQWMPRLRKITPDGMSTIILTVEQMPGARPKSAGLGIEFLKYEFVNPFLEVCGDVRACLSSM
jgi:sugar lactone lactonase YvrE